MRCAYPVPIRSMRGDGNVGGGSIDHVVSVGVDSVIATLKQGLACHVESCLRLEMIVEESGCLVMKEETGGWAMFVFQW